MDLLLFNNSSNSSKSFNIPDYLLNINNKNSLYYNVFYWIKYVSRIFLIIHSKYNKITCFYIKYFLAIYEKKIIILNDENENQNQYIYTNSNTNTSYLFIQNIINNLLIKYEIKDLLISNTSIIPSQKIDFDSLNSKNENDIYIFTYGNKYQYNFENKIIKTIEFNGNVIGIYLIKNYKQNQINNEQQYANFEYYLNNLGKMYEIKIEKINDYSDIDFYTNNYQNKNINIFNTFNYDYVTENNKILKKSKYEGFNNSIKREIIFYKYIQKYDKLLNLFPKLLHFYENAYVIEYDTNYKKLLFINNNIIENEKIIIRILDLLNILHNNSGINLSKLEFINNLKIETYQEIINSVKIIDPILQTFPKFKKVNNIFVDSFQTIIDKFSKFIFNYYNTLDIYQYNLIHGNSYFSNILINTEQNILFIEPKGCFGNTQNYGLKDYDYSKILLSTYIYNNFDIDSISNDEICFHNSKIELSNIFIQKYFNKIHFILSVLQLFKLAEYNKNDPFTCILCYYYGLYLGTLL
jgi:hypothetical protein